MTVKTREVPVKSPENVPRLIHSYPAPNRTPLGPGSIARCGHVKDDQWSPRAFSGRPIGCVVCAELKASA